MFSIASSLAAMNILLAVLCSAVAWIIGFRLWKGHIDIEARTTFFGLMFFAGGWAFHRTYWAVNRAIEAHGHEFLLTSVYKHSSWITLFPMSFIVLGIGLVMEPVLHQIYGDLWLLKYMATMTFLWIVITVLV